MKFLNQRKRGRKEGKEENGPRGRYGGAKTDPYRLPSGREYQAGEETGVLGREVREAGERSESHRSQVSEF